MKMTGRIRIFIGGLALGLAFPWSVWSALEEAAHDAEKAKLLLSIAVVALVFYLAYDAGKTIFKE